MSADKYNLIAMSDYDKNGRFRGVWARGGCFGAGLSIHHQARFKRLDFVIVTSGFFCLGSRLLGILVIGFDVLGHDFAFFLLKFTLGFYWKILFFR